jgi:hypothetical protein
MTDDDMPVTCVACGASWTAAAGRACTAGCAFGGRCGFLRCPVCGWETPAPTALARWLGRWLGGERARPA